MGYPHLARRRTHDKKTITLLTCLLLATASAMAGGPIEEDIPDNMPPNPELMISYNEVMIEFSIADRTLTYAWQAPPDGADNLAGPEDYFWQSVDIELADYQLDRIRKWLEEHKVYELQGPDDPGDEESYEAVWYHDLEIYEGEDEFALYWTDAARWNDSDMQLKVNDAIGALKELVRQFAGSKM